MKLLHIRVLFVYVLSASGLIGPPLAVGQTAPAANVVDSEGLQEIVVTAEKRSEPINKVPMSINAFSAATLQDRGVVDTADLAKIVPSFTYTPTFYATPVYTIRGVGLYESGFASSPAVSVYVDQVSLPYPVMTQGATLDLERVEVLKGPQGTLFGENATGGAINYIAAKPTSAFSAGASYTFGRFNESIADAYVSGPVTDTLNARLAVRTIQGGAYQESLTRPGDYRGNNDQAYARILLDWKPIESLSVAVNLNAWRDDSDTLAPQLVAIIPSFPARATPALLNSPIAPNDARFTDWPDNRPKRKSDDFYQLSSREDYSISNALTLTAITAYEKTRLHTPASLSGSADDITDYVSYGQIQNFNQEVRVTGVTDWINWLVGLSYDHTVSDEESDANIADLTIDQPLPFIPPFTAFGIYSKQRINTEAAFANIQFKVTNGLTARAGVRYTDLQHNAASCNYDNTSAQNLTAVAGALQGLFQGSPTLTPKVPPPPYSCLALDPAKDFESEGVLRTELPEHNISWRAGFDYLFDNDVLIYINDSRGFKAGIIPELTATFVSQLDPAVQERVDAYEIGTKVPMYSRKVELTAAGFYYDYKNKQVRGSILDPTFGVNEKVVNVPKSEIWGGELGLAARPIEPLTASLNASYVHSAVTGSGFPQIVTNLATIPGHFDGSPLPFTPKFTGNADLQYAVPFSFRSGEFRGLTGISATYHSLSHGTFETNAAPTPTYNLPAYALFDLRAGFGSQTDSWQVLFWSHNVGNKFYLNDVQQNSDTRVRFVGEPRTFGVTVSARM